jgi:hypothetical protein
MGRIRQRGRHGNGSVTDDYDPIDDAWASVAFAYEVIRERMKNGGPGWTPKPPAAATALQPGVAAQRGQRAEDAQAGTAAR